MNHSDSSMFAPLGVNILKIDLMNQKTPPMTGTMNTTTQPIKTGQMSAEKKMEEKRIDALRVDQDLIDLNSILKKDAAKQQEKAKTNNNNSKTENV